MFNYPAEMGSEVGKIVAKVFEEKDKSATLKTVSATIVVTMFTVVMFGLATAMAAGADLAYNSGE